MVFLNDIRTRSITVLPIQAGGCKGCALQLSMALSLDDKIKGITLTGNPKHADALLVTGCINEKSRDAIQAIYEQMPVPKAVIVVGACSCSGSLFRSETNTLFTTEDFLPVDAWIRGCAPDMHEILEAVVRAIECCQEREKDKRTDERNENKKQMQKD